MLIFLLTFLALIVIGQIQSLSQSGIRLISGERLSYLFFRSLARDGLDILLFGLPAFLIASVLVVLSDSPQRLAGVWLTRNHLKVGLGSSLNSNSLIVPP